MRFYPINKETLTPAKIEPLPPGSEAPPDIKFQYLPRIRCLDCPGKLYTARPGRVIEDFEVHLRNRSHKDQVDKRLGRSR